MSNLANGRVILKFKNSVLVQKNSCSLYSNFILNLYKVNELIDWPRNHANNVPLKNCQLAEVKLVRNAMKIKIAYNGRGIAFDRKVS